MSEHIRPDLGQVARRLTEASDRLRLPTFDRIVFPDTLDRARAVFPLELISLQGLPEFSALSTDDQWQLGLLETVNFFSLNIHGEQALVASLAHRLYRQRGGTGSVDVSRYLQHFIDEENAHTYMLAEFCQRYHGQVMPEIVYPFEVPDLSSDGQDLLLFCRAYVLETLLDFVNRRAMQDDSIDPTARAVHRQHHLDETRHLAFDRALIRSLTHQLQASAADALASIAILVDRYADYVFSRLANPRVYRLLALPDPLALVRRSAQSSHRRGLQQAWWSPVADFLSRAGLPVATPALVSP